MIGKWEKMALNFFWFSDKFLRKNSLLYGKYYTSRRKPRATYSFFHVYECRVSECDHSLGLADPLSLVFLSALLRL
jgi:hypothetical protein